MTKYSGKLVNGARGPLSLGGTANPRRAEWIQRLQVGGAGLALTISMIALASIIIERASNEEAVTTPSTVENQPGMPVAESPPEPANSEPLVDLGVIPDLPAENAVKADENGGQTVPDLEPQSDLNKEGAAAPAKKFIDP